MLGRPPARPFLPGSPTGRVTGGSERYHREVLHVGEPRPQEVLLQVLQEQLRPLLRTSCPDMTVRASASEGKDHGPPHGPPRPEGPPYQADGGTVAGRWPGPPAPARGTRQGTRTVPTPTAKQTPWGKGQVGVTPFAPWKGRSFSGSRTQQLGWRSRAARRTPGAIRGGCKPSPPFALGTPGSLQRGRCISSGLGTHPDKAPPPGTRPLLC